MHNLPLHTQENTASTAGGPDILLSQRMFISHLVRWVDTKQSWDEHNWKTLHSLDLRSVVFKLEGTEESRSMFVENTDSHMSPQKLKYSRSNSRRSQGDAFLTTSPGILMQRFAKCGLQTLSISITWELITNANPLALPQTYWIRNQGGPQQSAFNKAARWLWCMLNFESHCIKRNNSAPQKG